MKTKFKQLFVLLAACLLVGNFAACSKDDDSENLNEMSGINYVVRSWDGTQVVSTEHKVLDGNYTVLENHEGTFNADAVNYVVKGEVTITGPMFLNPKEGKVVNIILTDECIFRVCGIAFAEGTEGLTLNIYGQSDDSGKLVSNGSSIYWSWAMPGIGNALDTKGIVNIFGGTIKATGSDSDPGIGTSIGGGNIINIYGGKITAQGGNWGGTGIGGGYHVKDYGTINIYGGEDADGADVTITGGIVVAKTTGTDEGSRAIGPGDGSDNYGSLTLGDNMMVTSERKANAGERKAMCWYRTNVRVEPCTHEGYTAETCPYHQH